MRNRRRRKKIPQQVSRTLIETFNGDIVALDNFLLNILKPGQYVRVTKKGTREIGWIIRRKQ